MIPAIDDVSKSYASDSPEISPSAPFQPEDQILLPFLLQSSQENLAGVSDIELYKRRRNSFCQPMTGLAPTSFNHEYWSEPNIRWKYFLCFAI